MPLSYNTTPPTASNKNTINDISVLFGVRDFLLNKNINNLYPTISTSLNGSPKIGEPVLDTMIGAGNVLKLTSIEVDGILRVQNATAMNEFKDTSSIANTLIDVDDIYPLNNTNNSVVQDSTLRVQNATIMNEFKDTSSIANTLVNVDDVLPLNNTNPSVVQDSPLRVTNATAMNEFKDTSSIANTLVNVDDILPLNNTNQSIEQDSPLRVTNATSMNEFKDKSSLANTLVDIDDILPLNNTNPSIEQDSKLRSDNAIAMNQYKNDQSNASALTDIINLSKTNPLFPNSSVPNGIGVYPASDEDIAKYGLLGKTTEQEYRKKATIKNLYLDYSKQVDAAAWMSLQPGDITQQISGYLDEYGALNGSGGSLISAADIIGSALNGQGLGLAKSGVITNFDLRASLAGRVLGGGSGFKDTKLGQIGGQQLVLALLNNAAFNTEQQILGSLNGADNVLSLVKDGTLAGFRPNYHITVPTSTGGRVIDAGAKILGFTLPKSYLNDAGSIFLSESNSGNIERANSMILNTGRGQVAALIANANANLIGTTQYDNPSTTPFRTGYAPGYKDNKGEAAINPLLYAYYNSDGGTIYNFISQQSGSTGVIPEISYNRSAMIKEYGFTGPEENIGAANPYAKSTIKKPTFTWGSNVGGTVNSENSPFGGNIAEIYTAADKKKSLLAKTQLLFNDKGMLNIVSGFGDINSNIVPSQIQTAVVGGGISKGSAVLAANKFDEFGNYNGQLDTAANTYCRTWTTFLRYGNVSNQVRNSALYTNYPYRYQTNGSILEENGMPKIAPYSDDSKTDPKKFMFSIENLAWNENYSDLLPIEQGPGDLVSGVKGRIMWFPPYNIQFSENNTANWESTNFIGRGEPVYTYNNSERTGTLSFQIIVDHPSYLNAFRGNNGPSDQYIDSYFAGCVPIDEKWFDRLTVTEQQTINSQNVTDPQKSNIEPQTPPTEFTVYFANDVTSLPTNYESGLSGGTSADTIDYGINVTGEGFGVGEYQGQLTSQINTTYVDNSNYGLNGNGQILTIDGINYQGFLDPNFAPALKTYLKTKCPLCRAEVKGYASTQGNQADNETLATQRANNIVDYLRKQIYSDRNFDESDLNVYVKKVGSGVVPNSGINGTATDGINSKKARKASITFIFDATLADNANQPQPTEKKIQSTRVTNTIKNRFYDESNYFDKLKETDDFVFDEIRKKIKYFHPAFHSTTPEGLNSRLTFLLQCTRQGPSIGSETNNLAFGRAPVCILRIGDFYNTKIVIDNVGIDYEPLVWDLNPEGVGVQPMIANVNMSFKMIGGSTLMGPLNKLQNALSFNYFANTQVYDTRADYIAKDPDPNIQTDSKGKALSQYYIANGVLKQSEVQTKTEETIKKDTPSTAQGLASDKNDSQSLVVENDGTPTLTGFRVNEVDNTIININITVKITSTNITTPQQLIETNFRNNLSFILSNIDGSLSREVKVTTDEEFDAMVLGSGSIISFENIFAAGTYVLSLRLGSNIISKTNIIISP